MMVSLTFSWSTVAVYRKVGLAPTHFLYHNLGGLKFEDVTEKVGLTHTGWGQGVCAGDVGNHGYIYRPVRDAVGAKRLVPESG